MFSGSRFFRETVMKMWALGGNHDNERLRFTRLGYAKTGRCGHAIAQQFACRPEFRWPSIGPSSRVQVEALF